MPEPDITELDWPEQEIRARPAPICLLCGSPGRQLYAGLEDVLYGVRGTWSLARCSNSGCRLVWLDPMPLVEDLKLAYRHYYTHEKDASRNALDGARAGELKKRLRALHQVLTTALDVERERARLTYMDLAEERPGHLLELGSGDGRRLELMRAHGWTVEGQEIDDRAAAFRLTEEGIRVHLGDLASLQLASNGYDAIMMNHVLEHVPDPLALLRECLRILKPGGSVVAVTPNTGSLGARIFRRYWRGLEPPRHLHLFNCRNLTRIAEVSGFSRSRVRTSHANALTFGVASMSILATGRYDPKAGATSGTQLLGGLLFQLVESVVARFSNSVGEECVLRAWK